MKPTLDSTGDEITVHEFSLGIRSTGSTTEVTRTVCRALAVAWHGTSDWDLVYHDSTALRVALYDGDVPWQDQLSFDTLWELDVEAA